MERSEDGFGEDACLSRRTKLEDWEGGARPGGDGGDGVVLKVGIGGARLALSRWIED